eukprot:2172536-Karenia_brevis.AAC.1
MFDLFRMTSYAATKAVCEVQQGPPQARTGMSHLLALAATPQRVSAAPPVPPLPTPALPPAPAPISPPIQLLD